MVNRYYEPSQSEQMYRKAKDYWNAQCLPATMGSAETLRWFQL